MNYIGSKHSLLSFLEDSILSILGSENMSSLVFTDAFAGTGAVGKHFQNLGFQIIANDLQYYSYIINHGKLSPPANTQKIEQCIHELNNTKPIEGFIYNNYCLGGTKEQEFERMYFSDENGKKCDAMRTQIKHWKEDNTIDETEYLYLLYCLLEAIDKVANTASVYGAFLKKLKKSALKPLDIKNLQNNDIINLKNNNLSNVHVYNQKIEEIISELKTDVLYLDPPYNQRQYAPNYHVLETIALYDTPVLKGKTGLRNYTEQKSDFCSKKTVLQSFEYIIKNTSAKYIFLSYNNEGLMTEAEVREILEKYGEYKLFTTEYSRFKADKTENRNHTASNVYEYLHCMIKK